MAIAHLRSNRKATGGLYNKMKKKHRNDVGTDFHPIKLGPAKTKSERTLGGSVRQKMLQADKANVLVNGKAQTVSIRTVKENPANPNFVRMNIITKGAVIDTELGLAKVTSRPTQHGIVNAVLLKK